MGIHDRCFVGQGFEPSTVVELLRWRARKAPGERAYTFLTDDSKCNKTVTLEELDRNARIIAAKLQSMGIAGERALLIYPPGIDYILAFFGCLYAGVVAVPAYPPDPTRLGRTLPRLQAIVEDCDPAVVLSTTPILAMMKALKVGGGLVRSFEKIPFVRRFSEPLGGLLFHGALGRAKDLSSLNWISTQSFDAGLVGKWKQPEITEDSVAFLQYTSGSTRTPRGVILSHKNLLHNSTLIHHAFEVRPDHEAVIWLPIYHDMGLIGGVLQPLYAGIPCTLISPISFLQRPLVWLESISRIRERQVISGGPNFAFDLCVRKITAEQRSALDLTRWELAFSGAEPVRTRTIELFSKTFGPCGFRKSAFFPCYGLAEATLIVSGKRTAGAPVSCTARKRGIQEGMVLDAGEDETDTLALVGCGPSLPDQEIAIVDPESQTRLPPDRIGEIWVSGPSVAQGFWGHAEETEKTFHAHLADSGEGPFLRTGDLGFLRGGELFITGRTKDLMIIRGQNHYPQDIEFTMEQSHPSLRQGCGAAFTVDVDGEERLVVAQEVSTVRGLDKDKIVGAIRQAVAERHGLQIHAVALLKPRSIPKTSSGKIRRYACRSMFLDGTLDILESSILEKSPPVETEIGRSESLLPRALLSIEPQKRQELLESHLRDHLAGVLKASPSDLSMDQPISFWGVDSVMAVDLLTELERNMGVTLSIQQVFQDTTISQLAALVLGQLTRTRRDPDGFRIPAEGKKAISEFPLSYGQKALWFVQQMDPSSIAHNVVHAVQIRTDADLSALRKAFERLVARHPALRTSFLSRQGEPFQKVHDRVELCFDVEDATRWGRKKLDQELEEFTFRPFDLTKAPLLRVSVFLRNPLNHILIVSMHHLITDLWSMAIILAELPKLYDHEVTGGSGFPLPPLKTQYSDHVRWEAEMLAGPEGERLWDYWRNRLSGSLPLLDLPVDRPRPPALTDRGAARYFSFDSALTKRLDSLAEDNRTSLFTLLLAAFQTLLHRYTGQDDILVGSPRAGRRHKLARVIGYFINSVVLRGDFSGDPTFLEFLRQMHETVEAAFQHGAFPFPLLVQRLTPEREQGASPIFQVMFAWQKTTSMVAKDAMAAFTLGEEQLKAELGGLIKGPVFLERRATPFDLALWVAEGDIEGENRLRCTIEYKSALFDPETIDRMLGHFNTLLLGIAADPNLPISRLPLLTEREKRRFLKKQEDLPAAFVPVELVHHSLAAQAGRTPDAVALACLDKNLTYAEVNRRANQLSSCLHRAGIKPEEPVGVFLDRSPEAVISLFAILKSGGVYLPIDPASPPERIAFMIKDSGVRVILTQEKFRIKFSEFAVQCSDLRVQSSDFKEVPNPEPGTVICLDSDWEKIAGESGENLMVDATPLNLAYMIYTSGSTGLPKGVLVSHEAFAKHCQEVQEHYRLTPMDRILQFASLAFDASLEQIVPPLISGATVFLMGRDLWMPGNFHRKALELGLTVINLPPAYWRQVVANWGRDRDGAHSLRLIIIGGDLVHPEMVETWLQTSMRAACLLNAYGPTETTITATTFEIPPDPRTSFSSGRVPIGLPLPRRKGCILDKYGNPVPIRVAGELCLGGIGLARGYLGLPERTAEVFIPDPFIAVHGTSSISDVGARLYRTGDLCRYLPDGSIEFLGRIDDQVKLRGFRIELGEVETVLKQHPGVRDAAVLAKEEFKNEDKLLVAYLVLESQQSPSLEELRCHLQRKLPSHMVPAAFIVLDQFPMTAGGKPDRMGLLKMDGKFLTPQEERIPPRTPVEQDLADIWSELLGVRQLAVNDNFFDLGGHSLIATQIAARIRDLYGVDLSLRKFFEAPTIADLASAIVHVLAEEEPDLERLLSQVEALSQENASTMLDDEVQANFISWTPQHARKNLLTPASPAKPAPTSSRVDGSGTGVASKAPGAG